MGLIRSVMVIGQIVESGVCCFNKATYFWKEAVQMFNDLYFNGLGLSA